MRSALTVVVLVIVVVFLIWGGLHLFIRGINPDQKTPEGHFASACWVCHFVSSNAKIVDE